MKCCCCLVTQLCLTLCNPMYSSMPGSPVFHHLPELVLTHVHQICIPSNHLVICCPLLLLLSTFPSIRVFSNELALPIRWPMYWNFSFSISPSNEYPGLISFRIDWFYLLAVQGNLKSLLQRPSSKASLGRPRGMEWGGRREEGSGWGTHVYLWRINFYIWQI